MQTRTAQILIPTTFVMLWSTGFIGARLGLPYSEPFTFLGIRLAITAALLGVVGLVLRSRWPARWMDTGHIALVGFLLHACYLGGVFYAIELGMPTGIAALIVGLQPILTAILAQIALRESVSLRQWSGLLLGFVGAAMTLLDRTGGGSDLSFLAIAATIATVYQKRFCTDMDLISGTTIQYLSAATVFGLGSLLFETREIQWTGEFLFALGWLILVLSIGAVMLLMVLIKHGSAARVTSLFYLTPPLTAVLGFLLFDENLGLLAMAGMLLAVTGVAQVVRR
jgi:drug/metabolite transporter (DMT)-like permease